MDADDPRSIPKHDYTKGQLSELVDVIIRSKATLFVCAVGVPPRDVVDKLHAAGIQKSHNIEPKAIYTVCYICFCLTVICL